MANLNFFFLLLFLIVLSKGLLLLSDDFFSLQLRHPLVSATLWLTPRLTKNLTLTYSPRGKNGLLKPDYLPVLTRARHYSPTIIILII